MGRKRGGSGHDVILRKQAADPGLQRNEPPGYKKKKFGNFRTKMKITKEFSDALGFKLLSSFTGFMAEYPVEGAQIQKICDDSFKENCFKCYPIIADAGVDPNTYQPKNVAESTLRNELRKQFPIRKIEPEVVEIPKPEPKKPDSPVSNTSEPKDPFKGVNLVQTSNPFKPAAPNPKPALAIPKSPIKSNVTYVTKCQKCLFVKQAEDINAKKVQELRRLLNKEQTLTTTLSDQLHQAHSEIKKLQTELSYYKNDPEFQAILEYQKNKRQRRN